MRESASPTRYHFPSGGMSPGEGGSWIQWRDYLALEHQKDELRQELDNAQSQLAQWDDWASSLRYAAPEMQEFWWNEIPNNETPK